MLLQEAINSEKISFYLNGMISGQTGFEQNLDKNIKNKMVYSLQILCLL